MRSARLAVTEEIVAEIKEPGFEVASIKVVPGCAVIDQFADILGKAAAQVEESGGLFRRRGILKERKNTW
ncbi:MAG: hypothetical protein Q9184_008508, partial [Pyrenodesmia sp. 2 TL-2023]